MTTVNLVYSNERKTQRTACHTSCFKVIFAALNELENAGRRPNHCGIRVGINNKQHSNLTSKFSFQWILEYYFMFSQWCIQEVMSKVPERGCRPLCTPLYPPPVDELIGQHNLETAGDAPLFPLSRALKCLKKVGERKRMKFLDWNIFIYQIWKFTKCNPLSLQIC